MAATPLCSTLLPAALCSTPRIKQGRARRGETVRARLLRQAGLGGANGDARPSNDTSGRMAPAPLARGAWLTALAVGASWVLALGFCWSRRARAALSLTRRPALLHTDNPQGGWQRVVPG